MVSPASFEEVTTRYEIYIGELRDFFAGRNVKFGSPQDVVLFAERLGSPSFFRDEVSSLVRAIIYREQEGVSRPELLELVAIAVGGPQIENRATEFERSLDQISEFLGSALRSLWGTVPDELPEEDQDEFPAPDLSTDERLIPKAPAPSPATAPPSLNASVSVHVRSASPSLEPPAFGWVASGNGILSHALSLSSEELSSSPKTAWNRIWVLAVFVVGMLVTSALCYEFPYKTRHEQAHRLAAVQAPVIPDANASRPSLPVSGGMSADIPIAANREFNHTSSGRATSLRTEASHSRHLSGEPHTTVQPRENPSSNAFAAAERVEQTAAFDADDGDSPASGSRLTPPGRAPKHDDEGVFFVSSGLMTDSLLSAPAPDYPRLAKLTGVQGSVVMQVIVSPAGAVSATRVLSGHWLLRSAAEHAVRRWTYRPYVTKGRATDVSTIVTIDFRLHR